MLTLFLRRPMRTCISGYTWASIGQVNVDQSKVRLQPPATANSAPRARESVEG